MAMAGKICPPVPPPAIIIRFRHVLCYASAISSTSSNSSSDSSSSSTVFYFFCLLLLLTFFPSSCSTFRATLKIIPIDKQVNKKLLPPILTNGSVTPVTGNKFTFTAMLAIACITNVKLNPNARKAPNA